MIYEDSVLQRLLLEYKCCSMEDQLFHFYILFNSINKEFFYAGSNMLLLQDRVIINRLDSICQAVLKGKWPGTRRVYEPGGAVASFYTTKLLDNSLSEDPSASPQGSKVTKHVAENKEFSVKLNDVC